MPEAANQMLVSIGVVATLCYSVHLFTEHSCWTSSSGLAAMGGGQLQHKWTMRKCQESSDPIRMMPLPFPHEPPTPRIGVGVVLKILVWRRVRFILSKAVPFIADPFDTVDIRSRDIVRVREFMRRLVHDNTCDFAGFEAVETLDV